MRCDFIFPPSVYPARLRRNGGWKPFFRPACRVPRIGQRLISFWFMAAEVIGLGACISKPHQLVKIMAFILTGRSVTKSLASPSVVNIFPYLLSGGGHPFDLVPRISKQWPRASSSSSSSSSPSFSVSPLSLFFETDHLHRYSRP